MVIILFLILNFFIIFKEFDKIFGESNDDDNLFKENDKNIYKKLEIVENNDEEFEEKI
jgi:hypothetical protein